MMETYLIILLCFFKFSEEIALRKDPHARLKHVSAETKDILQQLEKEYKAPEKKEVKKEVGRYCQYFHINCFLPMTCLHEH